MTAEGAAATGNGRHWRLQWRRWPERYTKEERGSGAKEGGEAHVAEWRRVGAKRVLGDVGRGGGSVPRSRAARWTA